MTLSLALRNLFRNPRRSLTTLLAMVLGLMAVLLLGGFIRDITYQLQSDYVRRTGHLQVQRNGYFLYGSGNPSAYGIPRYERVLSRLQHDAVLAPMLVVATPILQFGGIAGNFAAGISRTVYVSGVIGEDQSLMAEWNEHQRRMLRPHMTLAGSAPDAAVIGIGVGRVLGLCAALAIPDCRSVAEPAASAGGSSLPGDIASLAESTRTAPTPGSDSQTRIEILATNAHGAPNVVTAEVLKAEFQGIKELDDVYVGLHLAHAQRLVFGREAPQVTAIALQLKHTEDMPAARARIAAVFAENGERDLEVIDYETLSPFYGQTLSMFGVIFGFVSVLIGAVVLFTISNTMSMTCRRADGRNRNSARTRHPSSRHSLDVPRRGNRPGHGGMPPGHGQLHCCRLGGQQPWSDVDAPGENRAGAAGGAHRRRVLDDLRERGGARRRRFALGHAPRDARLANEHRRRPQARLDTRFR
jgi:putative ABC transport system permease protein